MPSNHCNKLALSPHNPDMPNNDTEVAIIGGGAAGFAAARRLHEAASVA